MSTNKVPGSRPILILSVLILAEVVAAFEGAMIWAAVRVLQELLGDSLLVGWVISSYYLVSAGAAVVGARLGDLFGRQRVLIWVLIIAGFGSLICALFPENLTMLLVGRAIQGVSAAVLPLCFGIVRETVPPAKVMPAIGLLSGTIGVAAGAGLLIGGLVVDYYEWYWIFHISVMVALVAAIGVWLVIPKSSPAHDGSPLDILGGLLFPPGMALILFGITQARYWTWGDMRIWVILAGGVFMLGYWARHEWRHKDPLINVRLIPHRQVALCLVGMVLACGPMQTNLVLSMLVQAPAWSGLGLGLGATVVGVVALFAQILGLGGGLWAARLLRKYSARYAMIVGASMLIPAWGALTLGFYLGYSSLLLVVLVFLIYGVGLTVILAVIPMALIEVVPAERTSEATGMASVVRQIALAITTQVVSALLAFSVMADPSKSGHVYPSPTSYMLAGFFITLCCVLIMVVAMCLPRRVLYKQETD